MQTLLLSLIIFGLSIAGLAAGLLLGRGPIQSSCGGLACIQKAECVACPHRRSGKEQP